MPPADALRRRLAAHDQGHVLRFWDELTQAQRAQLAGEIEGVDLDQLAREYQKAVEGKGADASSAAESVTNLAMRAEPPPAIRLNDPAPRIDRPKAIEAGEAQLRAGEVGVVLVAGGQGTRLGFDAPKGMFPIGPVSGATLLRILLEKIVAVERRYGAAVPLYVMTSPATHDATQEYLDENGRFGLSAERVRLFRQGTMPAVDAETGRLLLEDKQCLALSPDGHGGMLAALDSAGHLDEMREQGIRRLFYVQVDNPLVQVCDPAFLGYHALSGSELSTQVVAKHEPLERVGNVVAVNGKVRIIEYSDLPDEPAERRGPDGTLLLWAGNIAVHVFDLAFLSRVSRSADGLPWHVARKKVPHIDAKGQPIEPAEPNALKFERFIFDLLPLARQALVVEVDKRRVFAPLKNAPGDMSDSPETVRRQMIGLHSEWLRAAGAKIDEGVAVEIGPMFAIDPGDLVGKIERGLRVSSPRYFG